jgi:hypothetical protein
VSQRTDHRGATTTPHFGCNVFRKLPHCSVVGVIASFVVLIIVDRHPPSVLAFPHFLIILFISSMGHLSYGNGE